ncbi:MAG TPA: hypothetical protein DCZ95_01035 [Verrucomicrobia bacterium]|nr:MAG: hypothetical protein A2X46_12060 [Lentisphaerae bacterium GWF2_57_35]HBA82652.1 hypothetical protein [Verrucomicrobiota bacterium]
MYELLSHINSFNKILSAIIAKRSQYNYADTLNKLGHESLLKIDKEIALMNAKRPPKKESLELDFTKEAFEELP